MQDSNDKYELVEKKMLTAIHFMKNREPFNKNDTDAFVSLCEQSLYKCLLPDLTDEDAFTILNNTSDFGCVWRLLRAAEKYPERIKQQTLDKKEMQ